LPIATTPDQLALQASIRDRAKQASPVAAVRRLEQARPDPDYHLACGHAVALLGERGAHPAVRKLLGTAHRQAAAETALDLLGPDGAAETEASQEFLLTRCLSIAGGTTQILLTQIAERVLGLPR